MEGNFWEVNKMVYLNGKEEDDSIIDPAKHKFIGSFRPPDFPRSDGTWAVYMCGCHRPLWTVEECYEHWVLGHMDILQYVDIN